MISRKHLPLSALRAFEVTAQHLHMGKAGEELGVTHGAISHQIRALEDRLSAELFSRAHNRLSLTPAGMRLYEAVRVGFDILHDGTRNLSPKELSGPLTIACTQTTATSWAIKHICRFFQQYPTIDISIREIEPHQQNIPRDIDIAICYGEPKSDDRVVSELTFPLLFPVCSPNILQDNVSVKRPTDIANFTLIHDHQVSWKRWFSSHGLNPKTVNANIRFPNTSQALTAARLGGGVALGNDLETQEFIRDGQLIRLLDKSIAEETSYFLLTQAPKTKSLKANLFEEWIIKACAYPHGL